MDWTNSRLDALKTGQDFIRESSAKVLSDTFANGPLIGLFGEVLPPEIGSPPPPLPETTSIRPTTAVL